MTEGTTQPAAPQTETPTTFSASDYSADPTRVIAHASATGTAIVADSEGRPQVVISIPTVDLPTLGD